VLAARPHEAVRAALSFGMRVLAGLAGEPPSMQGVWHASLRPD
jgi:hypothetical protein